MTNPIKIFGVPQSQNVRKPLAVAYHHDIPIELVPLPPREPAVIAISPSGRIPAMDDNGFALCESNAIMIYLAGKAGSDLYPRDEKKRAKIHQWLFWDTAHWTPAYQPIQFQRFVKQLLKQGTSDEAVVGKALELFYREAPLIEAVLEKNDWLVGDGPTLADFAVGAGLTYAAPIRLPLEDYPAVAAWNARLCELKGWKRSAPQR
jgi:glutathione S-transferase